MVEHEESVHLLQQAAIASVEDDAVGAGGERES